MIHASRVVDLVLEAARADETIVLVTDRTEASLRWANNSMTTNGVSTSRGTTVISILRDGDSAQVGSLRSTEVDPSVIPRWWRRRWRLLAPRRERATPRPCSPVAVRRTIGMLRCRAPGRGVRRRRGLVEPRVSRRRPAVRVCPSCGGDDVAGVLGWVAAAPYPADRLGGDQCQT
ncbi:hypothetical protein I552_9813 [Mycobacterium xenopi 3993]|nr:hypothetical protein I552_9813 [Mycobacterium xenopi 3993]